ncbi:hypothetical protein CP982_35870 [Streptomyces spectabilis]|uniref:Uncharacterized protein n=1 Tax=Streptomyces spectabilis TaxID=68270 RepID=A0A5P2XFZ8_STRST|nr:hypothetical protein CP982_35870 [Streptomyces spectabilis]
MSRHPVTAQAPPRPPGKPMPPQNLLAGQWQARPSPARTRGEPLCPLRHGREATHWAASTAPGRGPPDSDS